ncbi:hypothetical protein ACVWW4_000067 [Bradyrhizobium sp. LB7.1]
MIYIQLPYIILSITNALRQIDPSLELAASALGGSFRQVTLPLFGGRGGRRAASFRAGARLIHNAGHGGGSRDIALSMLIAQQIDLLNCGLRGHSFRGAAGDRARPDRHCAAHARHRQRIQDGQVKLPARLILLAMLALMLFLGYRLSLCSWFPYYSASYLTFPPPGFGLRWTKLTSAVLVGNQRG